MFMCVDCSVHTTGHPQFNDQAGYDEHRQKAHGEPPKVKPKAPAVSPAPPARIEALETEVSALKNQLATVFTDLKLVTDRLAALENPDRLAPIS